MAGPRLVSSRYSTLLLPVELRGRNRSLASGGGLDATRGRAVLPREREDGIDSKYGIGVVISKRNVEPDGGIGQPPGTGRRGDRGLADGGSRVARGGWNLGEKDGEGRGGVEWVGTRGRGGDDGVTAPWIYDDERNECEELSFDAPVAV